MPEVYDREKPGQASSSGGRPDIGPGHDRAAGKSSDPRSENVASGDASDPRGELRDAESGSGGLYNPGGDGKKSSGAAASDQSKGPSDLKNAEEKSGRHADGEDGSGGLYNPMGKGKRKLGKFWTKKRAAAGGGIAAVTGSVIIGGLSILQGPLQFTHFAQLLEKFHHSRQTEFGDGRGARLMIYAMLGSTERGRMGLAGNKFADKWEQRMVNKTGLRPLYRSGSGLSSGRLVGYEIVSDKRDRFDAINEVLDRNPKLASSFEKATENGAEVRSRNEALARGQLRTTKSKGADGSIPENHFIVDFRDVGPRGFKSVRDFNKGAGSSVVRSKLAGAMGSRVLTKRGDVRFGFFNNVERKVDERADAKTRKKQAEDYEKSVLKRWSKAVKNGVSRDRLRTQTDQDGDNNDGDRDTTPAGQSSSDALNDAAAQTSEAGDNGEDTKALREKIVRGAGGSALAVAVFCAVRGIGDGVDEYKYTNNVLPMMRMGIAVMGMGSQAQAGTPAVNLDEMGVMASRLHDKETGKSWTDAESVRAELGQSGGEPMPEAARLSNVGDQPDVFEIVNYISDKVPGLGLTCDALDKLGNLPIIRDVAAIGTDIIDGFLGVFGTNTTKLTEQGLGAIAGESVNALAKGAEFGNLANTGAFIGANDAAIASGGTALSDDEIAQLDIEHQRLDTEEQSQRSFIARYFDINSADSLAGSTIDNMPSTTSQLASLANPLTSFGGSLANLFSTTTPSVKAAAKYDYGTKTYGFSLADQNNDMFEDPYENAEWVEGQDLAALNDKYGKCFGMTVDTNGALQVGKSVNVFMLEKDDKFKDCRNDKDLEVFKRYRFYIADTLTLKSLNCYEGDEEACTEIGFVAANDSSSEDGSSAVSGNAAELAQQLLDSENVTAQPNPLSSLQAAARGDKSPAGVDQCGVQHPPVALSPKLLGFLVELARDDAYTITSLTTGAHGCTSNHYKGIAADFGCDIDTAKADRIGAKYGVSRYAAESCSTNPPHFHYSIGGN